METYKEKLEMLRTVISQQGLQGFIIPMNDEFQGEYIPDSAKRLEWLTSFNGSNGLAIVLQNKAAFFTDGRYTLQAAEQVPDDFLRFNMVEVSPWDWVKQELKPTDILGFDPWLHTEKNLSLYKKYVTLKPCVPNLIDTLWHDRPKPPQSNVVIHDNQYAGVSSTEKREQLAEYLSASGLDSLLLTAPDSICWLLNIRGNDVPHTPFSLCFAIAHRDRSVDLFIDKNKITQDVKKYFSDEIRIHALESISSYFKQLKNNIKIQIDPTNASAWFLHALQEQSLDIVEASDPCQLWKACKNPVELAGARAAHIRDGAAVTTFLHWLTTHVDNEAITELSATEVLRDMRAKNPLFQDLSFDTIAGFGSNGAIVHYRVTEKTSKYLKKNGIFLLDSGAQYLDGTTDITRTIVLGKPTQEQKDNFTRVLKGHIALALATFPQGTTGSQLDALARYHLWQAGLDYDHGTGHGVGSYLSVHEGPQRISKIANSIALQPGMIISNEPGYYKAGEYGIRIESLVAVIEKKELSKNKPFFGFETLTRAPIDLQLVNQSMLTAAEAEWLHSYHRQVQHDLTPLLNKETAAWLEQAIQG